MRALLLSALAMTALSAQETYFPTAKDAVNCPRQNATDEDLRGYQQTLRTISPSSMVPKTMEKGLPDFPNDAKPFIFPVEQRKSANGFAAMDKDGKVVRVSERKGKVIVIGLWATLCQASGVELLELADLQPKGEKYGFEVWPVNYDEKDRWPRVAAYMQVNGKALGGVRVFVPGLGKEGVATLAELVPALPAIFIIDREGRLAAQYAGYQPGALMGALKAIMTEKPSTPAAAPKP